MSPPEWETDSFHLVTPQVKPFLKWAGGKRALIPELRKALAPTEFTGRYFEPFLGSGSVFFSLRPSQAILSDVNWPLIQTFKVVKSRVRSLIAHLETLPRRPTHDHYYLARRRFNELISNQSSINSDSRVELAALMIWLNHTCFNGLFRVNGEGRFNVPIGFKIERHIFSTENLRAASLALRTAKAELLSASYEEVLPQAQAGDVVYLDPPYEPLEGAENFTQYSPRGFSSADQMALATTARSLSRRGCTVVISNSAARGIPDLYGDFDVRTIVANRRIGSSALSRGRVRELLITSRR